ncbi:MAG: thymidine phosphorylase, partial [Ignavibacteriae bacterium]
LVRAQGGDIQAIENLEKYPLPKYSMEVKSSGEGFIDAIDSFELGLTSIALGAGREKIDDTIDMKAGIVLKKKVGDPVTMGDSLALFYTDREEVQESARARISNAFKFSSRKPERTPMILDIIDKNGVRKWRS